MFMVIGVFSIYHFSDMENEAEDAQTLIMQQSYEEQVLDNKIRGIVNKAKSISDLEKAEGMLQTLPQKEQDRIAPYITLKKAAIWFNEAEEYLRRAAEIENATVVNLPPMPPPNDPEHPEHSEQIPTPQRVLHPLTTVMLNKALGLYEKARKESEKLKDTGDVDFNYHMNYLKGEIYYRVLEFLADQESAQEIFNQTLTYYKYALRNRGNDINTIVNIEILIKNQNGLVGDVGNPQRKKQMLNSKKHGIGKSTGN